MNFLDVASASGSCKAYSFNSGSFSYLHQMKICLCVFIKAFTRGSRGVLLWISAFFVIDVLFPCNQGFWFGKQKS